MNTKDQRNHKKQITNNNSLHKLKWMNQSCLSQNQAINKSLRLMTPDLEVIKLEYSIKLKIKRNDWLLVDTCPQATNHCALFLFENELKFYNLKYVLKKGLIWKQRLHQITETRVYIFPGPD